MTQGVEPVWQGMGAQLGAGYAWKVGDKVAAYLDDQEKPEQAAEIISAHACMLDLLGVEPEAAFRFVDLGAGAGAVAGSLMNRFPNATGVLADISTPMMEASQTRLADFAGRYRYVEYDMNADAWPEEIGAPYQAVVSARAIHHLTDERKGLLFQRIFAALLPGGVFVNWDLHRSPDEPQKLTHPVATAQVQLDLLRQAGFTGVSSHHDHGRHMVFYGKKP
jgi:trans-aconitate methyltransferase